MKLQRRMTYSCFFCRLLTAINPLVLSAQSNTTSAIAGTVMDATGAAALAGATVTAEDAGTGARRVGKTNEQGRFLVCAGGTGNLLRDGERSGIRGAEVGAVCGGGGPDRDVGI